MEVTREAVSDVSGLHSKLDRSKQRDSDNERAVGDFQQVTIHSFCFVSL